MGAKVIAECDGLYRVVPLRPLRRTKGVSFDVVEMSEIVRVDAVDRVIHDGGACSPGSVGDVERPWYMHHHQDDNLVVLHGTRYVEVYTKEHGEVEKFTVTAESVIHDGKLLYDGPAMLVWPRRVFHRIISDEVQGSASINLATHHEGFDIATNFSIYDLDVESGEYRMIRKGSLDQPM